MILILFSNFHTDWIFKKNYKLEQVNIMRSYVEKKLDITVDEIKFNIDR